MTCPIGEWQAPVEGGSHQIWESRSFYNLSDGEVADTLQWFRAKWAKVKSLVQLPPQCVTLDTLLKASLDKKSPSSEGHGETAGAVNCGDAYMTLGRSTWSINACYHRPGSVIRDHKDDAQMTFKVQSTSKQL